jgi:vacuolar-type H+-ATPase subunit C/Vma6
MAGCEYANARARARGSRLLGPGGAAALAARGSLDEQLRALRATALGPPLAAALQRGEDALAAVDGATAEAAAAAAREAAAFLDGKARRLFEAVLLPDAAAELKGLLRAPRGPGGGGPPALPLPALSAEAIRALASASPEAAADALDATGSPLGACLRTALAAPGARRDRVHLEAALDGASLAAARAALRGAHGADARVARRALERHADHANARTLLALGDLAADPALLVPGGALASHLPTLAALPLAGRAGLLARLLSTRRSPIRPEDLVEPSRAEAILAARSGRALAAEARAEPLSIAVPLAYVAAVRAEARRVRLVVRGGDFGVPPDELVLLLEA